MCRALCLLRLKVCLLRHKVCVFCLSVCLLSKQPLQRLLISAGLLISSILSFSACINPLSIKKLQMIAFYSLYFDWGCLRLVQTPRYGGSYLKHFFFERVLQLLYKGVRINFHKGEG